MAEYILDVVSQTSKLDWAFPFQRTGAFPIDRSAVFSSLADAQNYALGVNEGEEAKDSRKLGGTSYVGQVISVYEAGVEANEEAGTPAIPATVNAYIITPARGLMKLASTTASGDVSADIAELQGKVSALETSIGTKAEKAYVDEELSKKANADDVYKKTEIYTKTEVETYFLGQIATVGHLKREIVEALPLVTNADKDTIYMLKKTGGLIDNDHYEEYMVINDAWEKIGDTYVDLSNYATTGYVDGEVDKLEQALENKPDKGTTLAHYGITDAHTKDEIVELLSGKANANDVYTKTAADEKFAAKATTLAGYSINDAYTKEEVNAELLKKANQQDHNELVDTVNKKANKATTLAGYGITDAYTKGETYTRTEISELIAEITGGESAADVLAALNAYKGTNDARVDAIELTLNGREAAEGVEEVVGLVARVTALENVEADDNVIESIKIGNTALAVENKTVTLPIALATQAGLVKSVTTDTEAHNKIIVEEDGTMTVNNLNANKLVQTDGEWLILNGGSAKI